MYTRNQVGTATIYNKLHAVIDINADKFKPTKFTVYGGQGKASNSDSDLANTEALNAAEVAYYCYYAGLDYSQHITLSDCTNTTLSALYNSLYSYLEGQNRFLCTFMSYNASAWNGYDNYIGSPSDWVSWRRFANSMSHYREFINNYYKVQLPSGEGITLYAATDESEPTKEGDTRTTVSNIRPIQRGNKIEGIKFSQVVIDQYDVVTNTSAAGYVAETFVATGAYPSAQDYSRLKSGFNTQAEIASANNAYSTPGTQQEIKATVNFKDAAPFELKAENIVKSETNEVLSNLRKLEAGVGYTIILPEEYSDKEVQNIIFESSYYLYRGRIMAGWSTNGTRQGRIIVGGERVRITDIVQFGGYTPKEKEPGLGLYKEGELEDATTGPLEGAKFDVKLKFGTTKKIETVGGRTPVFSKFADKLGINILTLGATGGSVNLKDYFFVGDSLTVGLTRSDNANLKFNSKSAPYNNTAWSGYFVDSSRAYACVGSAAGSGSLSLADGGGNCLVPMDAGTVISKITPQQNNIKGIVITLGSNAPGNPNAMKNFLLQVSNAFPDLPIYVQRIPDQYVAYTSTRKNEEVINAYNNAIKEYCDANTTNLFFNDTTSNLVYSDFSDGLHMHESGTTRGYAKWKTNIENAIASTDTSKMDNTGTEIGGDNEPEPEPDYDAKFEITWDGPEIEFKDRITDAEGYILITKEEIAEELAAIGNTEIDIGKYSGAIRATFTETEAPEDYELTTDEPIMVVILQNGQITDAWSETGHPVSEREEYEQTNRAIITLGNKLEEEKDEELPLIEIVKVNQDKKRLSGVVLRANFDGYGATEQITTNASATVDRTIDFTIDIMKYNTTTKKFDTNNYDKKVVEQLSKVDPNNSFRLFDSTYLQERNILTKELREEYISQLVIPILREAIKETSTWKNWETIANSKQANYNAFVNAKSTRDSQENSRISYYNSALNNIQLAENGIAQAAQARSSRAQAIIDIADAQSTLNSLGSRPTVPATRTEENASYYDQQVAARNAYDQKKSAAETKKRNAETAKANAESTITRLDGSAFYTATPNYGYLNEVNDRPKNEYIGGGHSYKEEGYTMMTWRWNTNQGAAIKTYYENANQYMQKARDCADARDDAQIIMEQKASDYYIYCVIKYLKEPTARDKTESSYDIALPIDEIKDFAMKEPQVDAENPDEGTDILRDWLKNKRVDSRKDLLQNYDFGDIPDDYDYNAPHIKNNGSNFTNDLYLYQNTYKFTSSTKINKKITKNNTYGADFVPGKDFNSVDDSKMKLEVSTWDFFYDARYKYGKTSKVKHFGKVSDLLKVYTGTIAINITEEQTVPGYLLWKSGKTKQLIIEYDNYGDSTWSHVKDIKYQEQTTDHTGIDHQERRSADGEYDITKMILYNQNITDTFELKKYRVLNVDDQPMADVTFEIYAEILHKDYYGNKATSTSTGLPSPTKKADLIQKSKTFTKTTDSEGCFVLTTEDYYDMGIDVFCRWSGEITLKLTEKKTRDAYVPWVTTPTKDIKLVYEEGKLVNKEFMDKDVYALENLREENNIAKVDGFNTARITPQYIIKKIDSRGAVLRGAVFKVTVVNAKNNKSVTKTLTTNELGEIMIYAQDLREAIFNSGSNSDTGIDVANKWNGDVYLYIEEIKAPDGYKTLGVISNSSNPIIVHYEHGTITNIDTSRVTKATVKGEPMKVSYDDGEDYYAEVSTAVISIEDVLDSQLLIRKVDGDTELQDYIEKVTLQISINGGTTFSTGLDSKGYIDLTNRISNLPTLTGTLRIQIKEVSYATDNGTTYNLINQALTVILEYEAGKLMSLSYPDDASHAILDVSKSEDEVKVVITLKNTDKILEPVYIQKIDGDTNIGLANVDMKIALTTAEEDLKDFRNSKKPVDSSIDVNRAMNMNDVSTYTTSNEGIIAIEKEILEKIGIKEGYTGDLYVLIEEVMAIEGYEKPNYQACIKITYVDGRIQGNPEIIYEDNADREKAKKYVEVVRAKIKVNNNEERDVVKIVFKNYKITEPTEIVVSKRILTQEDPTHQIRGVSFLVTIKTENGFIRKSGSVEGIYPEVRISAEELATIGIDSNYNGTIEVMIKETVTYADIVGLPKTEENTITVYLTLKDGKFERYDDSTNSAHLSVKTVGENDSVIEIMIGNTGKGDIIDEPIKIEGKVWEEMSTTKAHGIIQDGLYTEGSDSEYSDKYMAGVMVTLYEKNGSNLTLANVDIGTNPIFTNANGEYSFTGVKGKNYIVKFTYNGQAYKAVPCTTGNTEEASKGLELRGSGNQLNTRDNVKLLLKEINAYPNNYLVKNPIIEGFSLNTGNIAYPHQELAELEDFIRLAIGEKLLNDKNVDLDDISTLKEVYETAKTAYRNENPNITDEEANRQLQFIYETRVVAYAGKVTDSGYKADESVRGTYNIASLSTYNENSKNVNLALIEQGGTDLELVSKIVGTEVEINGHRTAYDMRDIDTEYDQFFYQDDYRQKDSNLDNDGSPYDGRKDNGKGINGEEEDETAVKTGESAYYLDDKPMNFYINYEIEIKNTTTAETQLTSLNDYFENPDIPGSQIEIESVTAKIKKKNMDKYEDVSKYLLNTEQIKQMQNLANVYGKDNQKVYKQLPIEFRRDDSVFDELSLVDGEKLVICFSLKIKNISMALFKKIGQNYYDTWDLTNYAEINGYKSMEGHVDKDSNPGTFDLKEFEKAKDIYIEAYKNKKNDEQSFKEAAKNLAYIRQDDAWLTIINLGNNLNDDEDDFYHRTLSGNVWDAADSYSDYYNSYEDGNAYEYYKKGILGEDIEDITGYATYNYYIVKNEDGTVSIEPREYSKKVNNGYNKEVREDIEDRRNRWNTCRTSRSKG